MLLYELLYYAYILIFGIYVSMKLLHGSFTSREWRSFALLCPAMLLLQGACVWIWGMDQVRLLYPLITHLPTVLVCILLFKARWDTSLIAVIISYSLCQLPRWAGLVIQAFGLPTAVMLMLHLAVSHSILLLLDRYCLASIRELIAGFRHPLTGIGALPLIYYLYEYFMIYTRRRYAHILALSEFLPTGLILFFILFAGIYRREMERRAFAEQQNAALEMKLSHAEREIGLLRVIQEQTAIHRHDLRHHLAMIDSLLASGSQDHAASYIRTAQQEIEAVSPKRYCEHEAANLLLGAFQKRAAEAGAAIEVKASLPAGLSLPDTELCALLSNSLENAVNAVRTLPESRERHIDVYCALRLSKLLIEIRNPYEGEIHMEDGLPRAQDTAHGYGCRSIRSIAQKHQGVCTFDAAHGVFTLRIAIPLK